MSLQNNFTTLISHYEFKFKEKGSLFIGQACIVKNSENAETKLSEIKKQYYDATHNCYAYATFGGSNKYSDDGEPNGTAGIRILNAIEHFNITNVLVVVTRYYGGVKLGVGPLGKAYYYAAFEALNKADKTVKELYHKISITFDYDMTSQIHHYINIHKVKNIDTVFKEKPGIVCFINPDKVEKLREDLREISRNKVVIELLEQGVLL